MFVKFIHVAACDSNSSHYIAVLIIYHNVFNHFTIYEFELFQFAGLQIVLLQTFLSMCLNLSMCLKKHVYIYISMHIYSQYIRMKLKQLSYSISTFSFDKDCQYGYINLHTNQQWMRPSVALYLFTTLHYHWFHPEPFWYTYNWYLTVILFPFLL